MKTRGGHSLSSTSWLGLSSTPLATSTKKSIFTLLTGPGLIMLETEGQAALAVTGVVLVVSVLYGCWRWRNKTNQEGNDDDNNEVAASTTSPQQRRLGTPGSYAPPAIKTRGVLPNVPLEEQEALLTSPQRQAAAKLYQKLTEIPVPNDATIQEIFETVDTNQDGTLSRREVEKAIVARQFDLPPTVIMRAFEKADANKDGCIDRQEFFSFCRCVTYFENLYAVFCQMDEDGNRRLNRDEFVHAAHVLNVSNEDANSVFDEMDENQGGYVVFDEFCLWMAEKRALEDLARQAAAPKSTSRSMDLGAATLVLTTAATPSDGFLPKDEAAGEAKRLEEGRIAAEKRRTEEESIAAEAEAKRLDEERIAAEKVAAEAEAKRLEEERAAAAKAAAEIETKRLEEEHLAAEKAAAEAEAKRLEEERVAAAKAAAVAEAKRLEEERIAAEKAAAAAEAKRLEEERVAAAKAAAVAEAKRLEEERIAAEMAAAEAEAKRVEEERVAAAKAAAEAEAKRLEEERIAAEKLAAEAEAKRLEEKRVAAAKAAAGAEAKRLEEERTAAEKAAAVAEAKRVEEERIAAAKAAVEAETKRFEEERITAEELASEAETNRVEEERVAAAEAVAEAETKRSEEERIAAEKAAAAAEAKLVEEERLAAREATAVASAVNGSKSTKSADSNVNMSQELKAKLIAIPVPEYDDIQAVFEEVDRNGDGSLSLKEVEKAIIQRKAQFDLKPTIIMRAFGKADVDGDGAISREEFFQFIRCITYFKNLMNIFTSIDTNNDRRLNKEEFLAAAAVLEVDDPEAVFLEMDENGGGYIVFDEFCIWMAEKRAIYYVDEKEARPSLASAKEAMGSATREVFAEAVSPSGDKSDTNKDKGEPGVRDLSVGENAIVSMPTNLTNLPTKEEALELFDKLDVDGSKTLSFAELGKSWKILFKNLVHKPSVMKAYRAADENRDGFVVRSEFEAFLRYITYHDNFHDAFSLNGRHVNVLGRENFRTVAGKLYVNDPDKVFDRMDTNHSSGVSYEEYCSWMARNTCQWKA